MSMPDAGSRLVRIPPHLLADLDLQRPQPGRHRIERVGTPPIPAEQRAAARTEPVSPTVVSRPVPVPEQPSPVARAVGVFTRRLILDPLARLRGNTGRGHAR